MNRTPVSLVSLLISCESFGSAMPGGWVGRGAVNNAASVLPCMSIIHYLLPPSPPNLPALLIQSSHKDTCSSRRAAPQIRHDGARSLTAVIRLVVKMLSIELPFLIPSKQHSLYQLEDLANLDC